MGEPIPGPNDKPNWWKTTSVYQVWPASYKDSTGSGVGDIRGIISTLPYLHSLGIETVWLSPMYKSPQHDMGYDISDYEDIHAPDGTLQDMQDLINGCHKLNIKIILDLVINHSSDEHLWFEESRTNKTNPKADCFFLGSAWEYAPERNQYYLHLFTKWEPDFNWENEEARNAIHDSAIRFWLKRGVDGFRIDTCNIYSRAPGLPDLPIKDPNAEFQDPAPLVADGPRAHEFLKEMRKVFDEFGDIMTEDLRSLEPYT